MRALCFRNMTMRPAFINVCVEGRYPNLADRLAMSLETFGYKDATLRWKDEYPPGSPPHRDENYAFKKYALHDAARGGYNLLVWLDAPMVAVRDPALLLEQVERDGYAFFGAPQWNCGEWSTDACLAYFGVGRVEAFSVPMFPSSAFGLSLAHPIGREVYQRFIAVPYTALNGSWYRNDREAPPSPNPRVLGHRHDQSALSLIAYQLGLAVPWSPTPFAHANRADATTIFVHDRS